MTMLLSSFSVRREGREGLSTERVIFFRTSERDGSGFTATFVVVSGEEGAGATSLGAGVEAASAIFVSSLTALGEDCSLGWGWTTGRFKPRGIWGFSDIAGWVAIAGVCSFCWEVMVGITVLVGLTWLGTEAFSAGFTATLIGLVGRD